MQKQDFVAIDEIANKQFAKSLPIINASLHLKKNDDDISEDTFMSLGAISYRIGLAFVQQSTPNEKVIQSAIERLKDLSASDISNYLSVIDRLRKSESLRESFNQTYNQLCAVSDAEVPLSLKEYKTIKRLFASIVDNSLVPIQYALPTKELLNSNTFTFANIIQINTLINEHLTWNGHIALNAYTELYNPASGFVDRLMCAVGKFDETKLVKIYMDMTYTMMERLDLYPAADILINGNLGVEFDTTKREIPADLEIPAEHEAVGIYKADKVEEAQFRLEMSGEEFRSIMEKNPDEGLTLLMWDMNGSKFADNQTLLEMIDELSKSETGKNIYHLLKAERKKLVDNNIIACSFNPITIVEDLDIKIKNMQAEYKTKAEKLFTPIPSDKLKSCTSMIATVLQSIVYRSKEQKQYLLSQYLENSVNTYNQLQQVVGLIEQSEINGKYIDGYSRLYDFVSEKLNIQQMVEETSDLPQIEQSIAFHIAFKDWYETINTNIKQS